MVGIMTSAARGKTKVEEEMKRYFLVAVLAFWPGLCAAQPWIPVECKARNEGLRSEFARKVREAKRESHLYVPKPFPRSDADVIEDFKYGYGQMFKGMELSQIPQEDWPLYAAIQKGSLSIRVVRVENWAPDRCSPDQQRDFFYLLHISDSASGQEIARAIVNQSGFLGGWGAPPDPAALEGAPFRALAAPPLEEALAQVRARFGLKGAQAQYVTTWGTPQCALPVPCVAFQAGGKNYLYLDDKLVEFTLQSRGYSRSQMEATRTRRFEISSAIDTDKEWLVSVAE
jgi:hypothetical protein